MGKEEHRMTHSKTLEETKLWQEYTKKTDDDVRKGWIKTAYKSAREQLKAVRDTFENYTLHDETHVLNVLDAMAGLLGNQIEKLSVCEAELLIIAAAFHDLGMVYTDEERENCLSDSDRLREYYSANPDMRGKDIEDWDKFDEQNYLRWLHPFRVDSVLQQSHWQALFADQPDKVVQENVIIAVCRAHGESPDVLRREVTVPQGNLKYQRFKDIDPLFCAILLRLADILDFDDSRAPSVLFSYSGNNEKSVEEWKKHMDSMGFNYPNTPSSKELPYGARFTDPTVERAANKFLDWIDDELSNSRSLLMLTNERWNDFVFPYQVDRSEIERVGYDYGDFKITMDQDRILDLLVGADLYSDPGVFVRELLQNSIDATLTRAKMDSVFAEKINTYEARIDLWEWWDNNGDLWFRIDDFGTGMTRGMLEKYFLKVGNSYYNSQEIKRDLNGKAFQSISRFGIGFLSCFLCGVEAYVSTKYWNPEKNIREAARNSEMLIEQKAFGLRLDVVGLNGYYTLKNQAVLDNHPSPLPSPPITGPHPDANFENDGFRVLPGTSIAIRIDPGKLGANSLLKTAKRWACFPRMPLYFNGKRLCMTHNELVTLAKAEQGTIEYELSDEEKLKYNEFLPELCGRYPKIKETINLFEADSFQGLPKLKILFLETTVSIPDFRIKRYRNNYRCTGISFLHKPEINMHNLDEDTSDSTLSFQSQDKRRLWDLFSDNEDDDSFYYGWKGIIVTRGFSNHFEKTFVLIVLDEDEERPVLKVNRDDHIEVPLKTGLTISAWLKREHPQYTLFNYSWSSLKNRPLKEWRALFSSGFGDWMDISSWNTFRDYKKAYENGFSSKTEMPIELSLYGSESFRSEHTSNSYIHGSFLAYMQIHYRIVVDYSKNQFMFYEIDTTRPEELFDIFPPMPFCYGNTTEDCSILCLSDPDLRTAITANHPFSIWLLNNAKKIHQFYPRQFDQIIRILKDDEPAKFIKGINEIIEQLSNTAYRYGIDISKCPKLSLSDFKTCEE